MGIGGRTRKDGENDIFDVSQGAPPVGRLVFDDSKLHKGAAPFQHNVRLQLAVASIYSQSFFNSNSSIL